MLKRLHSSIVPLVLVVLIIGALGVRAAQENASKDSGQEIRWSNRTAPLFELPTLGGATTMNAATVQKDVSVVNFFASWCTPCLQEWPHLLALKAEGMPVYGISFHDTAANIEQLLRKKGDPFLEVGLDHKGTAGVAWGIKGVPETFVVGREGKILFHYKGVLGEEQVKRILGYRHPL
jgi:cytochrome c biogenesis protein CcmG, thiol:disulfide interchange protein DsbE